MTSWTFSGGRWKRTSPLMRGTAALTRGIRAGLNTLGYDVRRMPRPSWAADPWKAQQQLLRTVGEPVIFDVGANVGQTLERYARVLPNARIHSFEPFAAAFRQLAATAAAHPGARAHQLALGASSGEASFHVNPAHSTRNSLLTRPVTGRRYYRAGSELPDTVAVTVATADDFCAGADIQRIQVLKMDVQGAELQVLRGATGLLEASAIDLVFTEVMFVPHYEQGPLAHDIDATLRKFGYSLYNLYDLIVAQNGQLRYANALYVSEPMRTRTIDAFPPEP